MSEHDSAAPRWIDRVRHWLWLDGTQRTDNSEANRGFYPGGPPVYVNRKPVGWRFALAMLLLGTVIALAILVARADGPRDASRQAAASVAAPLARASPQVEPGGWAPWPALLA